MPKQNANALRATTNGGDWPSDDDQLLTRRELSKLLRCSQATLERWSATGIGPREIRIGGRVLVRLGDLRAFVAARSRG